VDLKLTEEYRLIQDMARDFAQKEVAPIAAEIDEAGRFPSETVKRMGELGFMGIEIPEEYGGTGLDTVSYVLAMIEVSKACASHGAIMSVNNSLVCHGLNEFGTEDEPEGGWVKSETEKAECMKEMPAFEIVSNPIEFEVIRPLDVVVEVNNSLKKRTPTRLSDVISAYLINRSDKPVEVFSPTLTAVVRLYFVTEGKHSNVWPPGKGTLRSTYGISKTLQPGEKVSILGPGEFSNDIDYIWHYNGSGPVKLQVVLDKPRKKSARIKSNWVDITIEK